VTARRDLLKCGPRGALLAAGDGTDPVHSVDGRHLAEWTIRMVEARALGVLSAMGR
jgi:hypothetical protein